MAVEDAEDGIYELFTDALAKRLVELTGKPLDMGDGECAEECIGGTCNHLFSVIEKHIQDSRNSALDEAANVVKEKARYWKDQGDFPTGNCMYFVSAEILSLKSK